MKKRIIHLARHGQTELNRLGVIQGSGINPPLNSTGEAQAQALFEVLKDEVDYVVSSGMLRAEQTAKPFVDAGIPYRIDSRFTEMGWGIFEGKVAEKEMRKDYKDLIDCWEQGDFEARMPGGESAAEMITRLQAAWIDFLKNDFSNALIVMHGRSLRCLVCLVEGISPTQMNHNAHSNTGYYSYSVSGSKVRCLRRNVNDHLEKIKDK